MNTIHSTEQISMSCQWVYLHAHLLHNHILNRGLITIGLMSVASDQKRNNLCLSWFTTEWCRTGYRCPLVVDCDNARNHTPTKASGINRFQKVQWYTSARSNLTCSRWGALCWTQRHVYQNMTLRHVIILHVEFTFTQTGPPSEWYDFSFVHPASLTEPSQMVFVFLLSKNLRIGSIFVSQSSS